MKRIFRLTGVMATLLTALSCMNSSASTFYINAVSGSDNHDGKTNATPWKTISRVNKTILMPGDSVLFSRGQSFRGNLVPSSGTTDANSYYGAYGKGNKPILLGSISRNHTSDWVESGTHLWMTTNVVTEEGIAADAGNIIFDSETSVGWKVSALNLANSQGKFYSDVAAKTVTMFSEGNPGSLYSSIEIAMGQHVINETDRSYISIENLDLRYSGAHGIGGSNTHHIIIRNVDISYIGGSYLSGTTRYGNGIEFYNGAHDNLVEWCTFSQIYDAALTNQGDQVNCRQYNIFYLNNTIRNSEFSFELWLRGSGATLHDIYFENNTCLDAGICWGHEQRVDPNASHLCFWGTSAAFSNISITNNIFRNSVGSGVFEAKSSLADLNIAHVNINNNTWDVENILAVMTGWDSQKPGPVNTYYDWNYYRTNTKQDLNSN